MAEVGSTRRETYGPCFPRCIGSVVVVIVILIVATALATRHTMADIVAA